MWNEFRDFIARGKPILCAYSADLDNRGFHWPSGGAIR
jgi:hypothetical protein